MKHPKKRPTSSGVQPPTAEDLRVGPPRGGGARCAPRLALLVVVRPNAVSFSGRCDSSSHLGGSSGFISLPLPLLYPDERDAANAFFFCFGAGDMLPRGGCSSLCLCDVAAFVEKNLNLKVQKDVQKKSQHLANLKKAHKISNTSLRAPVPSRARRTKILTQGRSPTEPEPEAASTAPHATRHLPVAKKKGAHLSPSPRKKKTTNQQHRRSNRSLPNGDGSVGYVWTIETPPRFPPPSRRPPVEPCTCTLHTL